MKFPNFHFFESSVRGIIAGSDLAQAKRLGLLRVHMPEFSLRAFVAVVVGFVLFMGMAVLISAVFMDAEMRDMEDWNRR